MRKCVVVITGAGSGLGRALSLCFCAEGSSVIGLGRQGDALKDTGEIIKKENADADFHYFQVDITNVKEVISVVDEILKQYGGIDFLYNNAAIYPKVNFLDESPEDFSESLAINVVGMSNLCKAILPSMLERKTGRIFNLGSWADLSPIANSAVYSASKGAVHALTKAIAVDIAHYNVDVQVHEWIPGHLNTQMSDYTGIDPLLSASWGVMLAARDNDKKNTIFERHQEWEPPKSIKQRIKDKLVFW